MIRPLRKRHRVIVCALGLLLPVAFVTGLTARKPVPVAATLPPELAVSADAFGPVVWTGADLWPGQRIVTRLRRHAGAVAVEFVFRDLAGPDVLVYWVAGKEPAAGGLPDEARLLGVLSDRAPVPIPATVRGGTGRFLLYSLAGHEVIAESRAFVLRRD